MSRTGTGWCFEVCERLRALPGFENAPDNTPWVVSAGVIGSSTQQPARSGKWRAWLCGYGATHTDTLMQQVAIPSTAVATSLTFWLHVDSAELLTSGAKDTLKVQIRDANGTVLETLATYSNLDAAGGYAIKGFDLQSYIGKTIQIYLVGSEVGTRQTSFVVDDFALRIK